MTPKYVQTAPPENLAVSLASVKSYLRVDASTEDTLLTIMIGAATRRLENLTDRKFVTQSWDVFYDQFPGCPKDDWWDGTREGAITELYTPARSVVLPFGPLQSVEGFFTYDEDDTEFEFEDTNFILDTVSPQGIISLKQSVVWPQTVLKPSNGIKISATFGFGDGATTETGDLDSGIPEDIQQAVKSLVGIMYEHRGDEMPKIPSEVAFLIEPYRRIKV